MMRKIALFFAFMSASIALFAADPAGLRVDISGLADASNIQITSAPNALRATNAAWMKEKENQYAYMIFPFSEEWKKADFSFITDKDGYITLIFQSSLQADKENPWIYIKDITITTQEKETLKLNDSEGWILTNKTYKTEIIKENDVNMFKVAYLTDASKRILVKSGQETTVSVWYKTAK